jgi:uncharacterized cupin superfamily protein
VHNGITARKDCCKISDEVQLFSGEREARGMGVNTASDRSPLAIDAVSAPLRAKPSNYPQPFFGRMVKREKRPLGDLFGLKNFGVNLTTLLPRGESALLHRHSKQDEFVYVLQGNPTLVTDEGEILLTPGMCAGFAAGGRAHQLVNRTDEPIVYLEIGDRTPGDEGTYPVDDLIAVLGANGAWRFSHKDGRPY